jgi:hypothetical protein
MTNDPHDQPSLNWQAFCYVAGELAPAERQAFEAQLAEDQQAREAVAQAVELMHLIAAAESQSAPSAVPASRSVREWRTRAAWVLVGGLASLLFAWLSLGPRETGWQGRRGGLERPRELAAAWVQTQRTLATAAEAGGWLPAPGRVLDGDDIFPLEWLAEELQEDEIAETPSWMVAAVLSAGQLEPGGGEQHPSRLPTRSEN